MGRKIDMKKIEDVTKCQVTFSKRRSSLMKKANEISICCDVDVAFVAFSPSGRISKFCNKKRIEDVLHRYVNIPPGSRLNHVSNVQSKMEKLRHLDHIKGEKNKLQFMDKHIYKPKQHLPNYKILVDMHVEFIDLFPLVFVFVTHGGTRIENLELQIKKSGLELQILEADLRDYEVDGEQEPSLHQLSWCERNTSNSLDKVVARKNALLFGNSSAPSMQMNQEGLSFPPTFNDNENLSSEQIMTQLDQWMDPYSSRVQYQNIYQDLLDHSKCTPNFSIPSNICNYPNNIPSSPVVYGSRPMVTLDPQIPPPAQQPFVLDQTLLNFPLQNNVNAWNNSYKVTYSNTNHNPTKNLYISQPPRFTSTTMPTSSVPQYDHNAGSSLQFANSSFSQLTNIEGRDFSQVDLDHGNYNLGADIGGEENNNSKLKASDQQESLYRVHPTKEISQDETFDNPRPEDALGDSTAWKSNAEKSNLWEWEDLLLDENLNLANISK